MKTFVKTLLPLVLLCWSFQGLQAQIEEKEMAEGSEKMMAMYDLEALVADLNLNEDQMQQIQDIQQRYKEQKMKLEARQFDDETAKKEAYQNMYQQQHQEMLAVLDADQQARLNQMMAEHQRQMQMQQGDEGEFTERGVDEQSMALERMRTELNLSDEQLHQMKEIQEKYGAKFEKLRAEVYDTQEAEQQAVRDLMEAQMAEMHQVLNEEQKAKLMEMIQKGNQGQ